MSAAKKLLRAAFRSACFKRDGNACRCCGAKPPEGTVVEDFLDAHHIKDRNEMPNGGYVPENGISLCAACHAKAEVWHNSDHQMFEPGYHPDALYKLIGSSADKATVASEKLGNG